MYFFKKIYKTGKKRTKRNARFVTSSQVSSLSPVWRLRCLFLISPPTSPTPMSEADLWLKAHVKHPVGLVHHHVGGPPQVGDAAWREEEHRHHPSANKHPGYRVKHIHMHAT